ncbi:MAG: hypothetical protein GEU88_21645 [Solirubrobacterales bacterium]|nr:hypothetical protein [Solirubrobacterales bacterium]
MFEAIWQALKPVSMAEVRAAVIEDTLHLADLWLSERSAAEVAGGIDVLGDPVEVTFDDEGRLASPV